jgi:hypothetical protein
LRRVLAGLGIATFVIMVLLWVLAPDRAYGGGDVVTKLFMYDPERGRHIYMPMFFGLLGIFTLNRSFWHRPRLWKPVVLVIAFVLMLVIYKERATIAGAGLALILGSAMCMGRWRWAAFAALAVGGGVAVYFAIAHLQSATAASGASSLGGSLAVRSVSVATAWSYLSADPLRWLLGVGATTRFGDITLAQLFGNAMFFLTDIGWLGVMFEYGVIGALLMLLVHLAGLRLAFLWARADDPLSQGCVDYIIYLLIVSAIYSVVFTPGELTTVMAICWFLHRQRKTYGGETAQPSMPRPRQNAMARPRPSGYPALSRPSGIASNG